MKALPFIFLCSCANIGLTLVQTVGGIGTGVAAGQRAAREIRGAFAEQDREAEYRRQAAHHKAWLEGREDVTP